MGKCTARLFYGLIGFVFLLYYTKVSSDSILDVMGNDTELCKIPIFLYNNTITSICAKETYPRTNVTADLKYRNTLLCLAFYDTWYKVNKSSPLCDFFNKNPTNSDTFNSHIRQFFPKKGDTDGSTFCKGIRGITFSYNKLEPLLSTLRNINNFPICYSLCFDMKAEFNPLCGILAWSKSININVNELNVDSQPELETEKPAKNAIKKGQNSINKNGTITASNDRTNDASDDKNKVIVTSTMSTSPPKPDSVGNEKHNSINTGTDNGMNEQKNNGPENPKSIHENSQIGQNEPSQNKLDEAMIKSEELKNQKHDEISQDTHKNPTDINGGSQNTHKEPQSTHNELETGPKVQQTADAINANDLTTEPAKDDDFKANIMPQVTQDHYNSVNQEEWNHFNDEKLFEDTNDPNRVDQHIDTDPNDLTDTDQHIDLGDQTQNIPKPSEEKDIISHYHSLRTDEESHFFTYFTIISLISIVAYIGYYNKQKILAIVLEGWTSRNSRGRRRPSTANYRKLDCTLEEAVTSQCSTNVPHFPIY